MPPAGGRGGRASASRTPRGHVPQPRHRTRETSRMMIYSSTIGGKDKKWWWTRAAALVLIFILSNDVHKVGGTRLGSGMLTVVAQGSGGGGGADELLQR